MNKWLLVLLVGVVQTNANANDLAYTYNVVGGQTVLTDKWCRYNKRFFEAYATDVSSRIGYACYFIDKDDVLFLLPDGTVRKLPKNQFKKVEEAL
jgi:hypothetical protein